MSPDPTSLDRLHDVVAPPPTPWWPPAPGWLWLLSVLVVLALIALARFILHWLHNRYRHEALAALAQQESVLTDPQQRSHVVANVALLLKRTALTAFPRETVASLTGSAWLAFLDRTGRTTGFTTGPGQSLTRIAYNPTTSLLDDTQACALFALVRHWLVHHHVDASPC